MSDGGVSDVAVSDDFPDLFADALELGETERRALLARLAERDPQRAGRLGAMLAAAERRGSLLDGTPPGITDREPSNDPPERVGPYRIVR